MSVPLTKDESRLWHHEDKWLIHCWRQDLDLLDPTPEDPSIPKVAGGVMDALDLDADPLSLSSLALSVRHDILHNSENIELNRIERLVFPSQPQAVEEFLL